MTESSYIRVARKKRPDARGGDSKNGGSGRVILARADFIQKGIRVYRLCDSLSLSLPPRACAVLHSSKHTIARGRASFSGSFHLREEGGDFLALSSGDCGDILVNARSVWVGSDVLISVFGVC